MSEKRAYFHSLATSRFKIARRKELPLVARAPGEFMDTVAVSTALQGTLDVGTTPLLHCLIVRFASFASGSVARRGAKVSREAIENRGNLNLHRRTITFATVARSCIDTF